MLCVSIIPTIKTLVNDQHTHRMFGSTYAGCYFLFYLLQYRMRLLCILHRNVSRCVKDVTVRIDSTNHAYIPWGHPQYFCTFWTRCVLNVVALSSLRLSRYHYEGGTTSIFACLVLTFPNVVASSVLGLSRDRCEGSSSVFLHVLCIVFRVVVLSV